MEQAFGKYLVFSGEYIWKFTHNAYDFSILGNTPIFFPIAWDRSKIPGFAGRVSIPNLHGFSALMVFSTVSARFFLPNAKAAENPTNKHRSDELQVPRIDAEAIMDAIARDGDKVKAGVEAHRKATDSWPSTERKFIHKWRIPIPYCPSCDGQIVREFCQFPTVH